MGFHPCSVRLLCVLQQASPGSVFLSVKLYLPHRLVRMIILVNVLPSVDEYLTYMYIRYYCQLIIIIIIVIYPVTTCNSPWHRVERYPEWNEWFLFITSNSKFPGPCLLIPDQRCRRLCIRVTSQVLNLVRSDSAHRLQTLLSSTLFCVLMKNNGAPVLPVRAVVVTVLQVRTLCGILSFPHLIQLCASLFSCRIGIKGPVFQE